MNNKATDFLREYITKTNSLIELYLNLQIKKNISLGKIPIKILESFKEMCLLGKKVRGALIVLSNLANGGKNTKEIYKASIFYEIFCTGILVQDDVMDNGQTRRGLACLHKQFDNNLAICISDFAYFTSYEGLLKTDFPIDNKMEAMRLLSFYSARLSLGQILDVTNTQIEKVSEKDILEILKMKSGEYSIILPMLIGAVLAGVTDEKKLQLIYDFGLAVGWVFQLGDDILGIFGEEEKLGKSITSDLSEGKITLLQLYLYQMGNEKQKDLQSRVLGNKEVTKLELEEMRNALRKSGALKKVEMMMEKYANEAINMIPQLTTEKKYQQIFLDLVDFLLVRKNKIYQFFIGH